jgi:multidrug transporter EmrE-like cation transporter
VRLARWRWGVPLFGKSFNPLKVAGIALVVAGIVALKLAQK